MGLSRVRPFSRFHPGRDRQKALAYISNTLGHGTKHIKDMENVCSSSRRCWFQGVDPFGSMFALRSSRGGSERRSNRRVPNIVMPRRTGSSRGLSVCGAVPEQPARHASNAWSPSPTACQFRQGFYRRRHHIPQHSSTGAVWVGCGGTPAGPTARAVLPGAPTRISS